MQEPPLDDLLDELTGQVYAVCRFTVNGGVMVLYDSLFLEDAVNKQKLYLKNALTSSEFTFVCKRSDLSYSDRQG